MKGLFVTFEGGEGLGKTTQSKRLVERLTAEGISALWTREPGGTVLGEKLREALLYTETPLSPVTELLILNAGRAQHVDEVIRPALQEGTVVVCDRYINTTIAYQGAGHGVDYKSLWQLHAIAAGNLFPDLTFVLEGEPHRERGTDYFERLGSDFHERVRKSFEKSVGTATHIWLSAARTEEHLSDRIYDEVWKRMRRA